MNKIAIILFVLFVGTACKKNKHDVTYTVTMYPTSSCYTPSMDVEYLDENGQRKKLHTSNNVWEYSFEFKGDMTEIQAGVGCFSYGCIVNSTMIAIDGKMVDSNGCEYYGIYPSTPPLDDTCASDSEYNYIF